MTTSGRGRASESSPAPGAFGVSGQDQDPYGGARFVNLTTHTVRLMRHGAPDLVLPPATTPAKVSFRKVGRFAGVDVMQREGEVEELPPPDPELNTFFIVGRIVKDQVPKRNDVVVPYGVFEDPRAQVTRCRGVTL